MTSNITECISGCLVDARRLTVIDLLEEARLLLGDWNYKNREITSYTKDTLGQRFEEILIVNTSKSSKMKVFIIIPKFLFYVPESRWFSLISIAWEMI